MAAPSFTAISFKALQGFQKSRFQRFPLLPSKVTRNPIFQALTPQNETRFPITYAHLAQ